LIEFCFGVKGGIWLFKVWILMIEERDIEVGDFALFFLFDNGVSVRESGKEVKG
jgi:hypothetical protein